MRWVLTAIALVGCKSERDLFEQRNTDTWAQAPSNEVDILWVVDNSGSMADEQDILAQGFASFSYGLEDTEADFHLGVITTSFDNGDPLAGVLVGDPPYLTQDDDFEPMFSERVRVGVDGSDKEKGLQAATFALNPVMTFDGGPNEGFVRPEAQLVVVFVSDEEDCSDNGVLDHLDAQGCSDEYDQLPPVSSFIQDLRSLKDDISKVLVGAIVGTGASVCEAFLGSRYIVSATLTGGLVGDICQPDWSGVLTDLGVNAGGIRTSFQLSFAAVPGTIEVYVDEDLVPENANDGWTYDDQTWFITFHGDAIPDRGSQIDATYTIQPGVPNPPADDG